MTNGITDGANAGCEEACIVDLERLHPSSHLPYCELAKELKAYRDRFQNQLPKALVPAVQANKGFEGLPGTSLLVGCRAGIYAIHLVLVFGTLATCNAKFRMQTNVFPSAGNQFLTVSVHGCSTAASGKFRMQVSKASAYGCPTVVSYKLRCAVFQLRVLLYSSFLKTAVYCARNQRLSLRGQAVPGKPRCTVKPSTASAWVKVMLNPPGVDWRVVNCRVHNA